MKKVLCLLVAICITCGIFPTSFAKTGDFLGYVKYTDISAYINHYPITSYNINGYTVVVAEDLKNYGFSVVWNQENRSLSISRSMSNVITPYGKIYKYESMLGQNSMPYLETDIKTYVNDQLVTSYNINGKTVINIEDLRPYGKVEWLPEIRAIKMWIEDLPQIAYQPLMDIDTTYSTSNIVNESKSNISGDELVNLLELIKLGLKFGNSTIDCYTRYIKSGDSRYKSLFDEGNNGSIRSYEAAYKIAEKYANTEEVAYHIDQIISILKGINSSGMTRTDTNGYIRKFTAVSEHNKKIVNILKSIQL